MAYEDNKRLIYFEGEEHLIRRLGAAVVVCWNDLDRQVRDQIINCAESILDEQESDHVDEDLKHLIGEHCPTPS